jgi:hypothetical protein
VSTQVLELPTPRALLGCWVGKGQGTQEDSHKGIGYHFEVQTRLCIQDGKWSFDPGTPQIQTYGFQITGVHQSLEVTGTGETWIEWNGYATFSASKGDRTLEITGKHHWRCDLADQSSVRCHSTQGVSVLTDNRGLKEADTFPDLTEWLSREH